MKQNRLFVALCAMILTTGMMAQSTNLDIVHIEGRANRFNKQPKK